MPRPDLANLGVNYRRVPVLAIGRDIYLDSRLQIAKLESLYTDCPPLGLQDPGAHATEALLSRNNFDGGVFVSAVQTRPSDLPALQNPAFLRDRFEMSGFDLREVIKKNRPGALDRFEDMFRLIESTLLSGDRKWILRTEMPSLADLEAVWPITWTVNASPPLPPDRFSAEIFPKLYGWVERFGRATDEARNKMGEQEQISGEDAAALIQKSAFFEQDVDISHHEDKSFKKGDIVTIGPSDYGTAHKETGSLVRIDNLEIVIETRDQDPVLKIHAPRHGFNIEKT